MSREIERLRPTSAEEIIEGAALLGNAFPVFGGVVSGIAMYAVSARRQERLWDFLRSVDEDLEHLKGISADQEEIVAEVLERVIKERSQDKTDCYRNILLNAVVDEALRYDSVLEMVRQVEQFTPNHIKLLAVLHNPIEADKQLDGRVSKETADYVQGSQAIYLRSFFLDWDDDQLKRTWEGLRGASVLSQDYPNGTQSLRGIQELSRNLSNYGRGFVRYVLETDSS